MTPIDPPRWSDEQFDEERQKALETFREERLRESAEQYLEVFDDYAARVRVLLTQTDDLSQLSDASLDILTDADLLGALRYLAGPPISEDDLKTLASASLSPGQLRDNPEMATRVINVVSMRLDSKRFPWVVEQRVPNAAERAAAAMASASLMATQRVQTARRNLAKSNQEAIVRNFPGQHRPNGGRAAGDQHARRRSRTWLVLQGVPVREPQG